MAVPKKKDCCIFGGLGKLPFRLLVVGFRNSCFKRAGKELRSSRLRV